MESGHSDVKILEKEHSRAGTPSTQGMRQKGV